VRITRHQMFMEVAQVVAKRSTCYRLNVGAVVVVCNRIVSIGYNGSPPGEPHCAGNECPGRHGCKIALHAEMNALAYVPIGLEHPRDLYVTDSPCELCAAQLAPRGVARVFFANPYRITDHLNVLPARGVETYRITPAGYIMNWTTGEVVELP